MKIIIIFLLVLSGIFLSCNHPIQPTILNTRPNYKQGAGIEYVKNQLPINTLINIPIHTLQEVCGCLDALMAASRESKKLRCLEDIIGHNREDYRFRGRSLSNQYAEQFNKSAEHHNKFLGYISQLCDSDSSLNSQIKGPLALAVFSKSPEVVLECITCLENKGVKIDINANDLFGMPVLHYAIASGDANMVKVLLEHAPRIHIDRKDKVFDFRVLLGQAICVGTTDIVKLLIEKDADPNWSYNGPKADEHGNGFRLAVIYDRKDMARHFIKKKLILLNQPDEYRRTSVMDVVYSCYPEWHEICLSLLQEEAAITPIDIDGRNVLMLLLLRYADIYRKYYQARNEFIDGYNCRPFEAEDIFQRLCKDKQEMLNCLFNQKDLPLIINQKDNQGKTTLAYFKTLVSEMNKYYDSKQAEIVKLLLSLIPKVDKDTERQIVHMLLDWMPQSDENMQAVRALISQVPSVDQDEKEAIVKMLIHVG